MLGVKIGERIVSPPLETPLIAIHIAKQDCALCKHYGMINND